MAALLVVFAAELLFSVRQESTTVDEPPHLYAGYEHWKARDFGVNPEHPPLVKMVAAVPLLAMDLRQPHPPNPLFLAEENIGGGQLLGMNGGQRLLLRARTAVMVFSLLAALLVFFAGYEMFGPVPGLLGMGLFCFEPTVLAHGALVTTDMGVTAMVFATVYAFWRYVRAPGWGGLLVCGLAFGLALVSKMSGVIVLPMLLLLAATELLPAWDRRRAAQLLGGVAAAAVMGYVILWALYDFRYAARPANGSLIIPPLAAFAAQLPSRFETGVVMWIARLHLLPEAYLYGWTKLPIDQMNHPAFLFGKVYPTGVPWYFPAALLVKSTITLLLLVALLPLGMARERFAHRREWTFLLLPLAVILGASVTSRLDIGVRHVLPMYPFAAVLAGVTAWMLGRISRPAGYAVAALLLFQVASSLHTYPNYLPYANEMFGGPGRTYRVLSDSNVDWGQQLQQESAYLKAAGIKDCWIAYSQPTPQPLGYGIPCKLLPSGLGMWAHSPQTVLPPTLSGVFLLGASEASGATWGPGDMNPYQQFQNGHPKAMIGSSVLVYEGTYDIPLLAAQSHFSQTPTLMRQGRTAEAAQEAKTAEAMAPNAAEVETEVGGFFLSQGQTAAAEAAFARALEMAKTHRPDDQTATIAQRIAVLKKPPF